MKTDTIDIQAPERQNSMTTISLNADSSQPAHERGNTRRHWVRQILKFSSGLRSQCSHLFRGIGSGHSLLLFQTKTNTSQQEKATEAEADRLLDEIRQDRQQEERLQIFDPATEELSFACGDGRKAVYLASAGQVRTAVKPFSTKLKGELVKQFNPRLLAVKHADLLGRISAIFQEYLYFEDLRLYLFLSAWVIGTYPYTIFSNYGYLVLWSKRPRCAKTRAQEVTSHLAFEASNPLNAPTPPVMREMAATGGTLQFDTLERWREKSQEAFSYAMELLDAGFRSGGRVAKMVSNGKGKWQKEEFPVYAPYVLAAIDTRSLSDTALDRSFPIEMKRKPTTIKKKRYNDFKCEQECAPVRDDLYIWALQNAEKVSETYESAELDAAIDALGLNDRAVDIWKPLFAILQTLDFKRASQEWKDLSSLAIDMHRDPEVAECERQLNVINVLKKKANGEGKVVGITTELLEHLKERGLELNQKEWNELMQEWGFEPKNIRLRDSGEPRRAWQLPLEKLREIEKALREQLPEGYSYTPKKPTTVTTRPDSGKAGREGVFDFFGISDKPLADIGEWENWRAMTQEETEELVGL